MKFHIVLDSFISLIYIHKKTQGIDFIMLSHSTHIRIEGHRFQYIYIYIYINLIQNHIIIQVTHRWSLSFREILNTTLKTNKMI